ncbi:MAG: NAD(P)-dependent oxidoreductase, partial [bacterium]|nr:NAD(P)-dependent oxidoreductase [bacterium]
MTIYIPEKDEIHPEAIELLRKAGIKIKYEIEDYAQIEALFIRTYTVVDKKYLDQFPHLKYILRAGVGLDNIDIGECRRRNIKVFNSPGANANAVAEYVVGLMIMMMRNILPQMNRLKKGEWRDKLYMGEEIKGKTIGIVGCGVIGKLVTKKLLNFEVKEILGYDPYLTEKQLLDHSIKKVSLDELVSSSDITSLHLPLTDETKNLFNISKLRLIKKGSYIINTSRGGIINETDLITAINKGW